MCFNEYVKSGFKLLKVINTDSPPPLSIVQYSNKDSIVLPISWSSLGCGDNIGFAGSSFFLSQEMLMFWIGLPFWQSNFPHHIFVVVQPWSKLLLHKVLMMYAQNYTFPAWVKIVFFQLPPIYMIEMLCFFLMQVVYFAGFSCSWLTHPFVHIYAWMFALYI